MVADLIDGADARTLFLEQLSVIDRAIRFASRKAALRPPEMDDFASWVMLKLIENDYGIIARYDRRSSFAGFISVVVQRLLLDYRIAQWGKWHASAHAKRLGEPAIAIETMLYRDGRTFEEIVPIVLRRWPDLTPEAVRAIADELPLRTPRPRAVDLELATHAAAIPDDAAFESDRMSLAERIGGVVREAMADLGDQERLLLRLRFAGGITVAQISRALQLDQKSIYRKLQRALASLRHRLQALGITERDIEDVLACRAAEFDFGFDPPLASSSSNGEERS